MEKWLQNAIETHVCVGAYELSLNSWTVRCILRMITPKNTRVFYTPEIWRYTGRGHLL